MSYFERNNKKRRHRHVSRIAVLPYPTPNPKSYSIVKDWIRLKIFFHSTLSFILFAFPPKNEFSKNVYASNSFLDSKIFDWNNYEPIQNHFRCFVSQQKWGCASESYLYCQMRLAIGWVKLLYSTEMRINFILQNF